MDRVKSFFVTYAFLIAVIFIVILLLSTSHVFQPDSICQLELGFSCRDASLTQEGITFTLYNEQETAVNFNSIAVVGENINCNPASATIPAKSSQVLNIKCTTEQAHSYDAAVSVTYDGTKTMSGRLIVK